MNTIKKIVLRVIILCLYTPYGFSQSNEIEFQKLLDSTYLKNKDAIGILLHIESAKNSISWNQAVGYSDKFKKEPLLKDQPALIASNTKTYLATAILKLVERGEIKLQDPIVGMLNPTTKLLLSSVGYDLDEINVQHLLSHTSGINDYVDSTYFEFVNKQPKHNWTRDEQITLAVKKGPPLANPGEMFSYGDVNYLLLSEVIEYKTEQPFYTAIRDLIAFEKLDLKETWFIQLEQKPQSTKPMAHQYWKERDWDSFNFDPSWDLYGGGGLASTVKDLGLFFHKLFNGEIIQDEKLLEMMYSFVLPNEQSNYCLGLRKISFHGYTGYYHGGFWGTDVMYLPELDLTIAIYTLEKGQRDLNPELSYSIIKTVKRKR